MDYQSHPTSPQPTNSNTISSLRALLFAPPLAFDPTTNPSDSVRLPGRWSETVKYTQLPAKLKARRAPLAGLWGAGEPVDELDEVLVQSGPSSPVLVDEQEKERGEEREKERFLVELAQKVLYQAGTDSATPPGPLLVIAPVHLPPQNVVDHYKLFEKLRQRLEAYTTSGAYSLVLLPTPTPNPPPTALLISSYLALPRMSRKNVRKVWVVGGGWWVRVILTLFSTTLLSGKTAKRKKIVQCSTLSDLAREMGAECFTRIEFPAEVYSANAHVESFIKMPISSRPPVKVFGESLTVLMGPDGELGLPRVVRDCLAVLYPQVDSVGIFRRSPSAATVKQLQETYERGHPVTLSAYPDSPYLAASLLKLFLRSLPSPLFPSSSYPLVRTCPLDLTTPTSSPSMSDFVNTPSLAAITHIRTRLLPTFSSTTLLLLQPIIALLHDISEHSDLNMMDSTNLVICLAPGMVGGLGASQDELEMCRVPGTMRRTEKKREKDDKNTVGGVLRVMIEAYHEIFDYEHRKTLDPIVRGPLMTSSLPSFPPSPTIWEEENLQADGVRRIQPLPVVHVPPSPPRLLSRSNTTETILSTSASSSSSITSTSSKRESRQARNLSATTSNSAPSFGTFRTVRSKASRGEVTVEGIRGLFSATSLNGKDV